MTVASQRPAWSVADVIDQCGTEFLQRHGGHLTGTQMQALSDLVRCRTAALGGHVHHCRDCGRDRIAYNSCRNRHCPQCQALARARWLEREARSLLPVEYFHVVFTLPAEVAALALATGPPCTSCSSRPPRPRSAWWPPIRNDSARRSAC